MCRIDTILIIATSGERKGNKMAYTTSGNFLVMGFRDIRENQRSRTIELGGLVVVTDDDAAEWTAVSKSVVRTYAAQNKQVDQALTADADSEVKDTARLYFLMPDDTKGHLDIVDPVDYLFLSTAGPGANVVIDYGDMATSGAAGVALKSIIDKCLAGSILISDGEQPVSYLEGLRI